MNSPQLENGFIRIALELYDAIILYPLPAVQKQCFEFIIRKTYGFGKKEDSISLSQFEKATNVDRRHIHRALKELIRKNVIFVKNSVTKKGTKKTSIYRINKQYKNWLVSPKKVRGSAYQCKSVSPTKVNTIDNITIDKKNIPDSDESGEFYLTAKKKKLTGKRLETFEIFWKKFNYKHGKADAADSWLNIPELTNAICNRIYAAAELTAQVRPELIDSGGKVKWAQGWLTSRRWEDEILQNKKSSIIKQNSNSVSDLMND